MIAATPRSPSNDRNRPAARAEALESGAYGSADADAIVASSRMSLSIPEHSRAEILKDPVVTSKTKKSWT
jgi:hypothetical protein